jgi:hypothetical protein
VFDILQMFSQGRVIEHKGKEWVVVYDAGKVALCVEKGVPFPAPVSVVPFPEYDKKEEPEAGTPRGGPPGSSPA